MPGGYVGVDVFFVISGFLITSHLLRQLDDEGRVRFGEFYARRARRILPAAFVVVAGTLLVGYVVLPRLDLPTFFADAAATALYIPNVMFAFRRVSYLAEENAPSLFQHFWSLGIEEQFYLLWPAALVLMFLLVRRSRRVLFWIVAICVVASFVLGAIMTGWRQPWAFFLLPTRAWELGAGGIAAFLISHPQMRAAPPALKAVLAWLGLAGIVLAALIFDDSTPFPGVSAALPVLATAIVILFSDTNHAWSPAPFLSVRPVVFIGTISYSLYLVHWPVLEFPAQAGGDGASPPLWVNLLLCVLAGAFAYLLYRFVEVPAMRKPWLRARPGRSLWLALTASVLVAAVGLAGWQITRSTPIDAGVRYAPSASSGVPDFIDYVPSNLTPTLQAAGTTGDRCLYPVGRPIDTSSEPCLFSENDQAPLIAVWGDSHAGHLTAALMPLVEAGEIQLSVFGKGSCPSSGAAREQRYAAAYCAEYQDWALSSIQKSRPQAVFFSNYSRLYAEESSILSAPLSAEEWTNPYRETLAALPAETRAVIVAQTPVMDADVPTCLSAHVQNARACGREQASALDNPLGAAESTLIAGDVSMLDLEDQFCRDGFCGAISGATLVYRDSHHITDEFAAGLAAEFRQHLVSLGVIPF